MGGDTGGNSADAFSPPSPVRFGSDARTANRQKNHKTPTRRDRIRNVASRMLQQRARGRSKLLFERENRTIFFFFFLFVPMVIIFDKPRNAFDFDNYRPSTLSHRTSICRRRRSRGSISSGTPWHDERGVVPRVSRTQFRVFSGNVHRVRGTSVYKRRVKISNLFGRLFG